MNTLRARAEHEAARFPPLLAEAQHLAGTVIMGDHGRRRSGTGDDFWQYRQVQPGDTRRQIDWRRSARSDTEFVRQQEWQTAQSVMLWMDQAASMRFASDKSLPQKQDRAQLLALALSILLIRAGERVGLLSGGLTARRGQAQIARIAQAITDISDHDYGLPDMAGLSLKGRAVFISDFLGPMDLLQARLAQAADRGTDAVILQLLDPAEEHFPYDGRRVFQSIGGTVTHETLQAASLKDRYLDRLAERKDELSSMARRVGWKYATHHTDASAQSALLWLYHALEGDRR